MAIMPSLLKKWKMKMSLSVAINSGSALKQEFNDYGRNDNFSNKGCDLLFDHLDSFGDENMVIDTIGLCCDYSEYNTGHFIDQYGIDIEHIDLEGYEPEKGKCMDFETLDDHIKDEIWEVVTQSDYFVTGDKDNDVLLAQG